MTLSKKQFEHLSEMNITTYVRREAIQPEQTQAAPTKDDSANIEVTLNTLTHSVLFSDLLMALNLSIADVEIQNGHVDLGFFNWQFAEQDQVTFHDSLLTTPSLEHIAQSTATKKQLWQCINSHQLAQ